MEQQNATQEHNLPQNAGCLPFSDLVLGALSYFFPETKEDDESFPPTSEYVNEIHVGMLIDEIKNYCNNELIGKKGNSAINKDLGDFSNKLKNKNKYIAEFLSILENEKKISNDRDLKLKNGIKDAINEDLKLESTINKDLENLFNELINKIKNVSSDKDKEDVINFYRFIDKVLKNIKNRTSKNDTINRSSINPKNDGIGSEKDKQDSSFSTINNGLIIYKISGLVEDLGQTIDNNSGADGLLELNFYRSLEDIFKSFIKSIEKRNFLCKGLYNTHLGFDDLEINTRSVDESTESIKKLTDCINKINNSSIFKDDSGIDVTPLVTRNETDSYTGETREREIKDYESFLIFLITSLVDTYNQIIDEITRVDKKIGIVEGMGNTFLDNTELLKALEELHNSIMTYINKVQGDEHFKIENNFINKETNELNKIFVPRNRKIKISRMISGITSRIKNLFKNPDD